MCHGFGIEVMPKYVLFFEISKMDSIGMKTIGVKPENIFFFFKIAISLKRKTKKKP
jgi:hypothetical protein